MLSSVVMDSIPTTLVSPFTPRKSEIGPIQNYSSDSAAIASIHDAIKNELTGKIQYDDSTMLERLKVDEVDDEVVRQCFDSLFTGTSGEAIQALQVLEADAASQTGPVAEIAQRKRDREMYPHLVREPFSQNQIMGSEHTSLSGHDFRLYSGYDCSSLEASQSPFFLPK